MLKTEKHLNDGPFAAQWQLAENAYQEQQWDDALLCYREALQLHSHEDSISSEEIDEKISFCQQAIDMLEWVKEGNQNYLKQNWSEALICFEKAVELHRSEFDFSKKEFVDVIERCKRGIEFNDAVQKGKEMKAANQWPEAYEAYERALELYHEDFNHSEELLETAVLLCQEKVNSQGKIANLTTLKEEQNRKANREALLIPLMAIGALIALISLYLNFAGEEQNLPYTDLTAQTNEPAKREMTSEDLQPMIIAGNKAGSPSLIESNAATPEESTNWLEQQIRQPSNFTPLQQPVYTSPAVNLNVSGNKVTGEMLEFAVANYKPEASYKIDFGNGVKTEFPGVISYAYKKPGTYLVEITANVQGSLMKSSAFIEISGDMDSVVPVSAKGLLANADNTLDSGQTDNMRAFTESNIQENPSSASQGPSTDNLVSSAGEDNFLPTMTPLREESKATSSTSLEAGNKIMDFAETMPSFPGGSRKLNEFVGRTVEYPGLAQENGIEGKVHVRFVVEKDGSLSQPKVVKGLGYGCDEEALRLIRQMPRWNPGITAGEAARVYFFLAVQFRLQE